VSKLASVGARCLGYVASLPFRFRRPEIQEPRLVSHASWIEYLSRTFNRPGLRVLEIGSRNVTGTNLRRRFDQATYVGFDYYAGENVDVVGDAHHLSRHFAGCEPFDLIFSSAVWEHLALPWVVADEVRKLLRVGGHVFIETHFSFASHERPWNFFQSSDMGLRVLFGQALGFEVVDSGMSNPICGFFRSDAVRYLRYRPVEELYCHSEILSRKVREVERVDWASVDLGALVDQTQYPPPVT
jgi:SAM-dependent methyltransferase